MTIVPARRGFLWSGSSEIGDAVVSTRDGRVESWRASAASIRSRTVGGAVRAGGAAGPGAAAGAAQPATSARTRTARCADTSLLGARLFDRRRDHEAVTDELTPHLERREHAIAVEIAVGARDEARR